MCDATLMKINLAKRKDDTSTRSAGNFSATFRFKLLVLALSLAPVYSARADDANPYPNMAPLAQYMSASQADEIALARTAAPASISDKAEILVLGAHGYETAVKGTNGFVCFVDRSWSNDIDNAEFWNPKIRSPTCANAAAARSFLPYTFQRTQWVMSGVSRDEMLKRTKAAIAAQEITAPAAGAMAFMLSKQQYVGDASGGQWYPHVMFYGPPGPGSNWGADVSGSPVLSGPSDLMPFTMYFIPVRKWSDGSLYPYPVPAAATTAAKPETPSHR